MAHKCIVWKPRRASSPDVVRLIDAADQLWQPGAILFEAVGGFAMMYDLLRQHTRFGAKLVKVTPTRDKQSRALAFGVHVEQGRFLLRGEGGGVHPTQQALFDEVTTFPFGAHDDLLDAAAIGTVYLMGQKEPRIW